MVEKDLDHSEFFVYTHQLGTKYDWSFLKDRLELGFKLIDNNNKVDIATKKEIKAITSILVLTSCRISEALDVRSAYIKLPEDNYPDEDGNLWINITLPNLKRKKGRPKQYKRIPILVDESNEFYFLVEALLDYYANMMLYFKTENLTNEDIEFKKLFLMSRNNYYIYCGRFFNINPHGIRKIMTQYLVVENNIPIKVIQKILGHSDLKNLDFYINLRNEDIKKALVNNNKNKIKR